MAHRQVAPDVIFSTKVFAATQGLSLSAASHHLRVLSKRKEVVRITRGVWAKIGHPHFSPFALVPWLIGQEQGYISFLTALHLHGAISQIPPHIQVATTGHSRSLTTPVGRFEFFQLKPEMMGEAVEWSRSHLPYRIASKEKALLDMFYLGTRRSRRFAAIPELHLKFSPSKLTALLRRQKIPSPISRAIVGRIAKTFNR